MADTDRNSENVMMRGDICDQHPLQQEHFCSNLLPCNPTSITTSYYPKKNKKYKHNNRNIMTCGVQVRNDLSAFFHAPILRERNLYDEKQGQQIE